MDPGRGPCSVLSYHVVDSLLHSIFRISLFWWIYMQLPSTMLTPQDVVVNSCQDPRVKALHLRCSKADPFGAGITIYLGRTGHTICLVSALLRYMTLRGLSQGPLFLFQDGSMLTKPRLLAGIWEALAPYGADSRLLMGHSFRIGAATAVAEAGLDDSMIQMLGRWHSSTYHRYIRASPSLLALVSPRLLGPIISPSDHSTASQGPWQFIL